MGKMRNACKILFRKLEKKKLLGIPKCERKNNIKIILRVG